jgi:hypothetical protein
MPGAYTAPAQTACVLGHIGEQLCPQIFQAAASRSGCGTLEPAGPTAPGLTGIAARPQQTLGQAWAQDQKAQAAAPVSMQQDEFPFVMFRQSPTMLSDFPLHEGNRTHNRCGTAHSLRSSDYA